MPVGDSRKDYILSTIGGHFTLSSAEIEVQGLQDNSNLNSFLDDGNTTSLCAAIKKSDKDKVVHLSNKVMYNISTILHLIFCTKEFTLLKFEMYYLDSANK